VERMGCCGGGWSTEREWFGGWRCWTVMEGALIMTLAGWRVSLCPITRYSRVVAFVCERVLHGFLQSSGQGSSV
jgi:hypothetical protein